MIILLITIVLILLLYLLGRILTVIHLIHVYNKAIKNVSKNLDETYAYLNFKHLYSGICSYCIHNSMPYIFTLWIERYSPNREKAYWYDCPIWYNEVDKIKELLILRKERLIYVLKRLTIF